MPRQKAQPKRAKPQLTVSELASMGGRAAAKARSPEERTRIARLAVNERWRRYRALLKAVVNAPGGTPAKPGTT